jgi:CRP-like cAMP-binding protein
MTLIDTVLQFQKLSADSLSRLEAIIFKQDLPKASSLLRIGEIDRYFHFIVKGSGRVYYLKDDLDVTDYIALDGQFLGGVESLFTQMPSHKGIELTENSTLESFLFQDFEKLCSEIHEIESLGRKLSTFAFLEAQRRIESIRFLSAAERYQELCIKYPGISNRIPLKHLASYLGTTPVSLSRIRAGHQ